MSAVQPLIIVPRKPDAGLWHWPGPGWFWPGLVVVSAFCAFCIAFLDRPLLLWNHAMMPAAIKTGFRAITDFGKAEVFLLPAAGVFLAGRLWAARAGRHAKGANLVLRVSNTALLVFCAIVLSGVAVNVLKILFGRYRPYHFLTQDAYGFRFFSLDGSMNAFPSGHAQVVWSAMTALALTLPRWGVALLLVAVLLSGSRFFSNYHYFSDIVMGAYLGTALTVVLYGWLRRWGLCLPPGGQVIYGFPLSRE